MSRDPDVSKLLEDGLSFFGTGDVARAVACWQRVLSLEPGNDVARDYLATADVDAEGTPRTSADELVGDARDLLERNQLEEALGHFRLASQIDPDRLESELYTDLLRAHLAERYRLRIGNGSARPRLLIDLASVARYNLSTDAGFLLSRLDGATTVDDLVSLSGMDGFEALQILNRLFEAGIIGVAG